MPLVMPGSENRIVLDAYVDNTDFDAKVRSMYSRIDELSEELKSQGEEIADAADSGTMSWTDFRSMYSTVLDVVRVGQKVWAETAQKYIDNAIAVGDMARAMGASTEEASRIKEVADDVGISMGTLTVAMKMVQKDGISPNVAGLAKLSDEYLALNPGVDRANFLMDKFGRSGLEMGKLLDKGSESITSMAAAVDKNMIVTQRAYEQARQYQISVDSLSDSWDAFTYSVAPPLVTAMTAVLNELRDETRAAEIAKEATGSWASIFVASNPGFMKAAAAEREAADAALLNAEAMEKAAESAQDYGDTAGMTTDQIKEMTQANGDLLSLTQSLQGEMDGYSEKLSDLTQKHADLNAELEQAIIDHGANSSEVAALIEKYNDAGASIDELKQKHADAMAGIAYDLFVAKLKAGEFTDAEFQMAIDAGVALGQIDQDTANLAKRLSDLAASAPSGEVFAAGVPGILATADAVDVQTERLSATERKIQDIDSAFNNAQTPAQSYGESVVTAGNVGTAAITETQNVLDSFSTERARDEIDLYIEKLNEIPAFVTTEIRRDYTTGGNTPEMTR